MTDTILVVDDDVNLLSAMRRQLRGRFNVVTAGSGEEALTLIKSKDRPAVILCDMRMGGMNGVETLRQVKELDSDIVRLMLTGNADMQTAIDAINGGNIFRFLTKPCPPETLVAGLDAALQQHRLIVAERELLEMTLAGSVKVLTDLLAMASPEGFRRANRISGWARKVAPEIKLPMRWQLDLAAMLAPLGLVSLPDEIIEKMSKGAVLTTQERDLIERSPEAGRTIIANIPRLAGVAQSVYLQNRGYDGSGFPDGGPRGADIPAEARVLKILNDLADVCSSAAPTRNDFDILLAKASRYDPALFSSIRSSLEMVSDAGPPRVARTIPTDLLRPGMILADDVINREGRLVLAADMEIGELQVDRLRNLSKFNYIENKISVFTS
jgi:response regulator RpfG family c-di-GMP phosphodiesterase